MKLATEQFLFPPQVSVLEDPAFVDQESEFYGGQQVNKLFAEISHDGRHRLPVAAVHGLRVLHLRGDDGHGDRRQGRHRGRPRHVAGPARQVRGRPGLHRRVSPAGRPPQSAAAGAPHPGHAPADRADAPDRSAARHPSERRSHRVATPRRSPPSAHPPRHRRSGAPARRSASSTAPRTCSSSRSSSCSSRCSSSRSSTRAT